MTEAVGHGHSRRILGRGPWVFAIGLIALAASVASISSQRMAFTLLGVETDFVTTFAPEAQRILAGEPLQLLFHPPGYAFTLALAYRLTGDWLTAGLWISGIAAIAAVLTSAYAMRRLLGPEAAWGALAGAFCSSLYMAFASQATSDMYFAALVTTTLALIVNALCKPGGTVAWTATGIAAGLTLLARTNSLPMALVPILPFLVPIQWSRRRALASAAAMSLCLPLLAWGFYADATNSRFMPSRTYVNLAVAAYGEGRGTHERHVEALEQFSSTRDVIERDPAAMAKRFAARLARLPLRLVQQLTWIPLAIAGVAGLLLALWLKRARSLIVFVVLLAALSGLAGITSFMPRLYLALVPVLGGFAAYFLSFILEKMVPAVSVKRLAWVVACLALAPAGWRAHANVLTRFAASGQQELLEAVAPVRSNTEPTAVIYARKFHLGFETGREIRILPVAETLPDLKRALCRDVPAHRPVYLYFGLAEKAYRRALGEALRAEPAPPWLQPIARGESTDWALFRISLTDRSADPASCM